MSFRYIILSRFKIKFLSFTVENESNAFDSKCFECSTHSKIDHDNESFVIKSNHSKIDITTITKATFVKKRNLKRQRNKRWKVKKQQSEFSSFSKLNSDDSMNIAIIDAIFFYLLIDVKNRKQRIQYFFITINQIDFAFKILQTNFESLKIVVMIKKILKHEQIKLIFERIMKKVSKYFRHLSKIFDFQQINKSFSHRFYDHKIEFLSDNNTLFWNRVYSLFELKLKKFKKYLKKNLQKKFIVFSQTTYVSLVLFAVKLND